MDTDSKHIPQPVRLGIVFHTLNKRALLSHKQIFLTTTLKESQRTSLCQLFRYKP